MIENRMAETIYGKVNGVKERDMLVFKGIPYAEPPVGKLRFKPPVHPQPWVGVLQADTYGNRAIQKHEQDEASYSEDCLNLNIWTPAVDNKKRPVVFYLHGGGHVEGSNSDGFATGQGLIRGREVVMVSVNYRLGALGYLYLGELLGKEYADSGNCGLQDQLLALEWVRENIAAFGGDPERIILMGQSAGAKSVAALMVTPKAQGLFQGAIVQSGATQCIRDTGTAAKLANYVLAELELDPANAKNILTIPAEQLLEAQVKAFERISSSHLFGPVIDGVLLKETPESFIASGKLEHLPVLIGYARDEVPIGAIDPAFDESTVADVLFHTYGRSADYLFERYKELCKQMHPSMALSNLQTQYLYGNASLSFTQQLAEHGSEVWCYRWDYTGHIPPQHASEMAYLFNVTGAGDDDGYTPQHGEMAERINDSWLSFIISGTPASPQLPHWPPYSSGESGCRMHLDKESWLEQLPVDAYDKDFPMQVIKL
ncbi:MAG: carboxylesterase family protein [Gorillibacterium sp.]|nr:carboxylesterase family protein [Gorillibacterium sp.]